MKYNFNRIIKNIATFCLGIIVFGVSSINSFAGASNIVIDKTSFGKELDTSRWNVPNGDVLAEDGKLIFTKDSTEYTKLITMNAAKENAYSEELFHASYTLKLQNIPKGKEFIAGFSLEDVESDAQEPESLSVVFAKDDGIKVSIAVYDENGKEKVLVDNKSCNIREGANFTLDVTATKEMDLSIKINNQTLYNKKSPIDLAGRIGFLQTGSCEAEISDVEIVYHEYERPENANVSEDFENGTFNFNLLTSKMISNAKSYPNGIQVEEYNGSNVLMFRSVAMGYFGTKYTYSNFEISFDIPFMQHKAEMDEAGQILAMQNSAFVVGIGDDASDYDKQHGYLSAAEGVVFNSIEVASLNNLVPAVKLADKNYFDMDKNEGYSVKISVLDAEVTVYLKALKASKYDKIMQYKLGNATPTGYIHFFANGQTNFAIDNLKIENKDQDANLLDVEYKESFLKNTGDWKYEPEEAVYLEVEDDKETFSIELLPVFAGVIGIIMIAISFFVARRKRGDRREE